LPSNILTTHHQNLEPATGRMAVNLVPFVLLLLFLAFSTIYATIGKNDSITATETATRATLATSAYTFLLVVVYVCTAHEGAMDFEVIVHPEHKYHEAVIVMREQLLFPTLLFWTTFILPHIQKKNDRGRLGFGKAAVTIFLIFLAALCVGSLSMTLVRSRGWERLPTCTMETDEERPLFQNGLHWPFRPKNNPYGCNEEREAKTYDLCHPQRYAEDLPASCGRSRVG
jgi:hypothetical protein